MYQTGQEVPASGIYRVVHRQHRLSHEVILIAGQKFPSCGRCSGEVRFELAKSAPYLSARYNVMVEELSAREEERDGQRAA